MKNHYVSKMKIIADKNEYEDKYEENNNHANETKIIFWLDGLFDFLHSTRWPVIFAFLTYLPFFLVQQHCTQNINNFILLKNHPSILSLYSVMLMLLGLSLYNLFLRDKLDFIGFFFFLTHYVFCMAWVYAFNIDIVLGMLLFLSSILTFFPLFRGFSKRVWINCFTLIPVLLGNLYITYQLINICILFLK